MRTWSVSGTAFALCTRSSSLSMSTSTSMVRGSLLLRRHGRAALRLRKHLPKTPGDRFGDQLVDAAPERGHFFHAARREKAVLRARHQIHRLDFRSEVPVEVMHLEFPLEIRDGAQALHHRLRPPAAREFDHELREDLDLDVVVPDEGVAEEAHPLVHGEHRLLVLGVAHDADDDPLEDAGCARDDVEMAVRDWVVAPRADRRHRRGVGHDPSKRVTRAEPYRLLVRFGSGSSGSSRASDSTTTSPSASTTAGRCVASMGRRPESMRYGGSISTRSYRLPAATSAASFRGASSRKTVAPARPNLSRLRTIVSAAARSASTNVALSAPRD